jgi:hypothetical protein
LLLSLVLQGTISVLAGTTGAISGTVVDPQSNQPVGGARVTAESPAQSATTTSDASGRFTFVSLAPDTYTVSVPATSTRDATSVSGVTVFADQTLTVTLQQPTKLKVIGSVTSRAASALVKPGTTADVYSVSAVQQDKASTIGGGGNLNSAWSAVATVPGVFIAPNQAGYIGAGATISIRGGDYDQIGYELDGVPVNRAFDNYPSSAISSLGQQELQVYTGANPANSEAQGISGYINQVIRTGTAPASRNIALGIGTPTFYNKASFETGGANPARTFSYYVGLGGYNQSYRYGDQYNGAQYNQVAGVPLAPCDNDPTSGSFTPRQFAPSCYGPQGQDYTNGGTTAAYVLAPYQVGQLSNIKDRDSIINLHFGINRKDGNRDDVQVLFDNNYIGNSFYLSSNDLGGINTLNNIGTLGAATYVDGYQYNGALGAFVPGNYQVLTTPYLAPNSPTGRPILGNAPFVDPNLRDGIANNQSILKLQYQRNFGTSAFLRVYGYTYYSNWLQIGPQSAWANYIGPSSPDYELSSHTRGVSATFTDQITSKHLLSLQGSYTTSRSLRDNNTQQFDGGGLGKRSLFAVEVDGSNPLNGTCYTAAGTPTTCDFTVASANFFTLRQAFNGTVTAPSGTCGSGPCQLLVVGNGLFATYNTVVPRFTAFSITDQWQPTDRLHINMGLRFDRFEFQGGDTTNSPARTFWYNAFNQDYCMNAGGGVVDKTTIPSLSPGINPATTPCPAGYTAVNISNPSGHAVEAYDNLQPRLGLTYTVNPSTVLRASYGRYVEAPNSAFQQYDTLQADAPFTLYNTYNFQRFGFTTPNHAVRPPVSNNYDFSFEHQFNRETSIKLTPFLRKTQDQIQQFFLDQQTGFVSGLNVGKQTSQGFELEVDRGDFSRNGIAAKFSFAYTNSYINYTRLSNGSSIIDPINAAIRDYNAYTSFCATHASDTRCAGGATASGGTAPCYTAAGAPDAACAVGSIANPYWNAPVQGLLDPNGNYPTYDIFPGGIGSSYQSYGAPYVSTLIVQYKRGPLAITPALQFIAGQRYGAPLTTPGVQPDTCTLPYPTTPAGDPRYPYGAPGGNTYDVSSCGGTTPIPDVYTGQFDGIGQFRSPSQILLHAQVTYDVNKRVTLVGNFANIVNHCFGGTGTRFQIAQACNYTIISPSGLAPVGNNYNPGAAIQPYLRSPYNPTFPGNPFNFFLEARIKL